MAPHRRTKPSKAKAYGALGMKGAVRRERLIIYLSQRVGHGQILSDVTADASKFFGYSPRHIRRLWAMHGPGAKNPEIGFNCAMKPGRGRPRKFTDEEFKNKMSAVPFSKRTTLRSLAAEMDLQISTLWSYLYEGKIKRHSNTIKPVLTDKNKELRFKYCCSNVQNGRFNHFLNDVHIDEKWYYLTKTKETYYLLPDEEPPERSCKSKKYITKVMFLCAMARPRYVAAWRRKWDGKIGMWPFIIEEPAK